MSTDLQAALLDVRKAYRLLADYQQRMIELLGFIRERLGADDYYHSHAHSLPKSLRGLDKQLNSGLRYLPFYDISAIWLKLQDQKAPSNIHTPGDLMFGAWVRSDTAYDIHTGQFNGLTAEQSSSALVLSVVICDIPQSTQCNWYDHIWCGIDYPEDDSVNSTDMPGYRCYAKAIDLAQLGDREAIENAINNWCASASDKLGATICISSI